VSSARAPLGLAGETGPSTRSGARCVVPSNHRPGVFAWALVGVLATFAEAIHRLGARAIATVRGGLDPVEWVALGASVVVLGYWEGYRILQRRFAPAIVERALAVADRRAGWASSLSAPLYALSLVGDEPRAMARAWGGVVAIATAVLVVRTLPAPWRGIVDAAVACALAWGLMAVVVHAGPRAWERRRAGRVAGSQRVPIASQSAARSCASPNGLTR
jgi:hypothetical protein